MAHNGSRGRNTCAHLRMALYSSKTLAPHNKAVRRITRSARHYDIEHLQSSDRRELFVTATKAGIQAVNVLSSEPFTGSVALSHAHIVSTRQFYAAAKQFRGRHFEGFCS